MKPFLLNYDGSWPEFMTLEMAQEYGLTPVLPTKPETPSPGYMWVEGQPELVGKTYYQQWIETEVPLDQSNAEPEPEPTESKEDVLVSVIQSLNPEQREALIKALQLD